VQFSTVVLRFTCAVYQLSDCTLLRVTAGSKALRGTRGSALRGGAAGRTEMMLGEHIYVNFIYELYLCEDIYVNYM
jgi:hypothetical protein